jgi:biotin carboxyl carrier protein
MKLKITVHGIAYEVDVEVLDPGEGFAPRPRSAPASSATPPTIGSPGGSGGDRGGSPSPASPSAPAPSAGTDSLDAVASPIAGVVTEVRCKVGDALSAGDVVLVIEAMKMNNTITAPTAGRVKRIAVAAGDSVREGQTLVELE